MELRLESFEQRIDGTILDRGRTYYSEGWVEDPSILGRDQYQFRVWGSEPYTVRLTLVNGAIKDHNCSCLYDWGPICKHEAAAIIWLYNSKVGSPVEKPKEKKSGTKKKSLEEQVNTLLAAASKKDLQDFVRNAVHQDKMLRDVFLASLGHLDVSETRTTYAQQVRSILRSAKGRHGFIEWARVGEVGMAVDQMLKVSRVQLSLKNYKTTFLMTTAVLEEMTKALQFADDSNGDIGGNITFAMNQMFDLAQADLPEEMRKAIFDYAVKTFKKGIFEDWDWHVGLLYVAIETMTKGAETGKVLKLLEERPGSEYEKQEYEVIRYRILMKMEHPEEAQTFLNDHMDNPKLRRLALQNLVETRQYDMARVIAQGGMDFDADKRPGLVLEWLDWLLEIALLQKDEEKVIAYARRLFVAQYSRSPRDYFQILKETVEASQWKSWVGTLISDVESLKNTWAASQILETIYIREEMWDRLLIALRQQPHLGRIERYEKYLSKEYSDELFDMYAQGISEHLELNKSRKHYKTACQYLRRMIPLGGRVRVEELIAEFRNIYSTRPALMEELERV